MAFAIDKMRNRASSQVHSPYCCGSYSQLSQVQSISSLMCGLHSQSSSVLKYVLACPSLSLQMRIVWGHSGANPSLRKDVHDIVS